MRSTLPSLLALASVTVRLTAQEPIPIETALTQVRLHPSEAWVTRTGHIHVPKPGNYRLRVAHLPEGLTLDDLRVQARGPEGTSLGEIRVGKEAGAGEDAPEVKAMKAKLDALNLRKASLESEEKAAAESMKLLGAYEDAVAKGSTQSLPGGTAVVESSRQLELRFRELMAQSDARARLKAQLDEEAARWQAEWQKLQARLGLDHTPSQVLLEVLAPTAGELELELTTRTRQARWTPSYEVRVQPDGQVAWVLYAALSQASGEPWNGVRVELSNANADQTPEPRHFAALSPLGWKAPAPMLPGNLQGVPGATVTITSSAVSVMATSTGQNMSMDTVAAVPRSGIGFAPSAPYQPAQASQPLLEPGATTLAVARGLFTTYRLEGVKDLPSDGESRRFKVASTSVQGRLLVTVAPRLGSEAFQVARFPVPTDLPLFPGQPVTRLYAGQRLGQGPLLLPPAGQPMELSLGTFTGLRAQFQEVSRSAPTQRSQVVLTRKVEKGAVRQSVQEVVETSTGDHRIWKLKEAFLLANDTTEPLEVEVQDRLLRSGQESVQVSVEGPGGHAGVDRPGSPTRVWTARLAPQGSERLDVLTTVQAPKDGEVTGLRELGFN